MSQIKIIAGLGNPGRRYAETRHNAGFMLLDALIEGRSSLSSEWQRGGAWKESFGAEVAEIRLSGQKLLFVKPQKFMNLSGGPLAQVMQYFHCEPGELVVAHDEIDLPLGALRVKRGGGDGGHNGIKSIVQALGSKEFYRLRLGVGRPERPAAAPDPAGGSEQARAGLSSSIADWVLSPLKKEEKAALDELLTQAAKALSTLVLSGLEVAQREFNQALKLER